MVTFHLTAPCKQNINCNERETTPSVLAVAFFETVFCVRKIKFAVCLEGLIAATIPDKQLFRIIAQQFHFSFQILCGSKTDFNLKVLFHFLPRLLSIKSSV
jgi:hypothetical protein